MAGCVFGQETGSVFGQPQAQDNIDNPEINEASGLVASVAHKGCFWTHNDSGDGARIFLIDDSARHNATYYLQGVSARDWEDIAMMERGGQHYLLIGDIGDNHGKHPYVHLHVLKEPAIPISRPTVDTLPKEQIRSFVMRYEDGPRDAESLFFDPLDKRLCVVSKRELEVGIYTAALPESVTDTLILQKVGVLPHVFITSATISSDGTEVLLKSLLQVFYWKRKPGESIAEMFSRPAIQQPYQPEPQGEAIAFAPDGRGYYTLGEAVLGMQSVLYFYERF
ncbi:hypothetical protein [Parapedobacter sp. 10938]|uniref:hypothetical protein n=1 Tax=Parapedobacter flavus TaxID=3110225 RepID=UPI002DBCCC27|nr:hypothetical protein [Parapedobacter sp. 10938]MEC3880893.1 hypothetical protein [Parapedobacter sp. 10938]